MSVKCIPLIPHFYIVKPGFTGIYLVFLFLIQNIDCGYSLIRTALVRRFELVPTINVLNKSIKTIIFFFSVENFQFLKFKKSVYIAWASL